MGFLGVVSLSALFFAGVEAVAVAQDDFREELLFEGFVPDPWTAEVVAGGSIDVDEGGCSVGYISNDHYFVSYESNSGSTLYIWAESDTDTTLFIEDAEGEIHCDDDSHTDSNPLLVLEGVQSGTLDIHVGTYSGGTSSATLYLSESSPGQNARKQGVLSIPGSVELDEWFLPDPYVAGVQAGGPVRGSDGECGLGYLSEVPTLSVDYLPWQGQNDLYVYAESDSDTTLMAVSTSGATYCNDDGHTGNNPLLVFDGDDLNEGFDIYVGTYNSDPAEARLFVSERAPGTVASGSKPVLPELIFVDGGELPLPYALSIVAGGSESLTEPGCVGDVGGLPNLEVSYARGTGSGDLHVYAESDTDVTLIVTNENGEVFCNDDGHSGTNPIVSLSQDQLGDSSLLLVQVGTYSGGTAPAMLYVSETPPGGGLEAFDLFDGLEGLFDDDATGNAPNGQLSARYGSVALDEGFTPDPYVLSNVSAGGSIDVAVESCTYGYVPDAPQVAVRYATSGGSDLYMFVESSEDTTLLVQLDDGRWFCNDDGYTDSNPVVSITDAPAGQYSIWIGTYGEASSGVGSTLYVSEKDPR
jgi:hypothetical protein